MSKVADNLEDISRIDGIETTANAAAPKSSPALTGNPTAPTQAVDNDSTRIATTEFVADANIDGGSYSG